MPARRPALRRKAHDEVTEWATSLPDAYLQCRDFGHVWRPFTAAYDSAEKGYRRTIRCTRCRTERSQILDLDGSVRSGHYSHPDGYLKPAGTGVLDAAGRGSLRLASTLRLIERAEQSADRRAS